MERWRAGGGRGKVKRNGGKTEQESKAGMERMERRHKVWVKKKQEEKKRQRLSGEEEVMLGDGGALTTHFENW